MGNLKKWILEEAEGEPVVAVVIGRWNGFDEPDDKDWHKGKVLFWAEAAPLLDYMFDSGYGEGGCHAVYAWTATKVIAIGLYDGSTWAFSIPRYPMPCMPILHGGG
jgi:hypothetical protein